MSELEPRLNPLRYARLVGEFALSGLMRVASSVGEAIDDAWEEVNKGEDDE